jgi:hypothetical protein
MVHQLSLIEGGAPAPDDVARRLEEIAADIELTQAMAAIRIGQRLAEARDLFRYERSEGGFDGWASRRLGYDRRAAYRFISTFESLGEKWGQFTSLSRAALFELAAPSTPEPVRQEVERLLIDGQHVTAADIKRLKKQAEGAEAQAERAEARAERLAATNKSLEERLRAAEAAAKRSLRIEEPVRVDNVVALAPKVAPQPEPAADDDGDEIDVSTAVNRAHAIRSAISTLDGVEITPAEFWAVFSGSEYTRAWVETAHAKLTAILEEKP